ncbi:hypothetical protein Lser_V15G02400 [Lactuca serriola]
MHSSSPALHFHLDVFSFLHTDVVSLRFLQQELL